MRWTLVLLAWAGCHHGQPPATATSATGWSCYAIDYDDNTGATGCARTEAACTAALGAARAWPSDTTREFHDCAPQASAFCYPTPSAPRCFSGADECNRTHDGLSSGATGGCAETK